METLTPCREWPNARTAGGYGVRSINGKLVYVHRWVVAQVDGEQAIEGQSVMHLCDNPACFRYDHLRIGTHADNMSDMAAKDRHGRPNALLTHCKRGHEFTPENTYVAVDGHRSCRTCKREAMRRYRSGAAPWRL